MLSHMLTLVFVAAALLHHAIPAAHASPMPDFRRLDLMPRHATILAADPGMGTIHAFNAHGESLGMMRNSTFS